MTEAQKRELERQANNYSFDFCNSGSPDISHAKFTALIYALGALGYEFVKDGQGEMLGTYYYKYKLVKVSD